LARFELADLVPMASKLTLTPLRRLGSKVNCINDISAEIRKKHSLCKQMLPQTWKAFQVRADFKGNKEDIV
jgi:hypothetical protein